ncbi:TlpA family protein disulfide reductase [Candidatus Nitrosacidococcus sp. I8]|uniref:TlpA family protein disulfide reductase n=1 Tax=Candidatus Nitrosacidococcus sp. I8 TaxID=2942908 RepID=UPI0022278F56|nr:redoxin family protein [Candidatus Nitrosacidococcus sp. I8]CAH9017700.1 Thiol-disulfide oxidoreductase ResA [Candidatus Nitrosacidococcus sp. I8]
MEYWKLGILYILISFFPISGLGVTNNEQAPSCSFSSLENSEQITLKQLKGEVVYLDFWASWCIPCLKSFPFLNNLHHKYSQQGLHILAVNLDEHLKDAKQFLTQTPADFEVAIDPNQQCAKAFSLTGMPSSFVLNKDGTISHTHLGFRTSDIKEITAAVEQALQE